MDRKQGTLPALQARTGLSLYAEGIAGASQLLSAVMDFLGHEANRGLVRTGRYVALAGSVAGPAISVYSLQKPLKWKTLVRIFRPAAPGSAGLWTIAAFGAMNGLVVTGQVLEDLGLKAGSLVYRIFQVPAAAAGSLVTLYLGKELEAAGASPAPHDNPLVPALFGINSIGSGIALLDLFSSAREDAEEIGRRLDIIGAAAGFAQLVVLGKVWGTWLLKQGAKKGFMPLPVQAVSAGLLVLGIAVPVAGRILHAATGRRSRVSSLLASLATLVSGFSIPAGMLLSGITSAGDRPRLLSQGLKLVHRTSR